MGGYIIVGASCWCVDVDRRWSDLTWIGFDMVMEAADSGVMGKVL